jgi:DNA repair photolyase
VIHKIRAKALLSRVSGIDTWVGLDFGMNLYRGCQHHCIYCDFRSLCYGNDQFDEDVLVKSNAIDVLRDELRRKRKRGILGTGSMNDPYMPIEERHRLTEGALEAIAEYGFGAHVITKSTLVLRDVVLLQRVSRNSTAAVSLSITTIDDELAHRIEIRRPAAVGAVSRTARPDGRGNRSRVALMPVLPFLEDSPGNVCAIVKRALGVRSAHHRRVFGVSLRDRQRAHSYARLDEGFPGVRARCEARSGDRYICSPPDGDVLRVYFEALCAKHGIRTSARPLLAPSANEPGLFA